MSHRHLRLYILPIVLGLLLCVAACSGENPVVHGTSPAEVRGSLAQIAAALPGDKGANLTAAVADIIAWEREKVRRASLAEGRENPYVPTEDQVVLLFSGMTVDQILERAKGARSALDKGN